MNRTPETIRTALDETLSCLSRDPALFSSVVNASKGGAPPVKRKLTLSMALILLLVLMTGSFAVAATYRGITSLWNEQDAQSLNPDYLMQSLQQTYTGRYLDAQVVDAYWDGTRLSVACHFTPKDAGLTLAKYCHCHLQEPYPHDCPNEWADLSLYFDISHFYVHSDDKATRTYYNSFKWVQETDTSLSVLLSFVVNDLCQPISISVPTTVYVNGTGETEEAQLQFSLPARPDPIPSHRHEWMEARCVNPKTCSICGRTEGDLGKHDFAPATCISPKKCTVCGTTWGTLSLRHPYNENGVCPICGKVKRQSSPAP